MSTGGEGQPPSTTDAEPGHPDDQLVGERIAGKYQVLRKLGAGGMGAVYEAEQQPLGRKVALKVIKRALTDEPMAVKRFINEARAVAQLNHANIVTIHDFGAIDGGEPSAGKALYIAMELLEGHDLRDEILKRTRLDWERSCRIVAEVARALAEAHTRGIVHRDLKPDNVMLLTAPGDEVRLKVVDFGVAKLLPEHGGTAGMTGTGMVVGTPGYISPEQINGIGDDPRSDLYALGVMWFEMLAGFSPYDAETPVKLVLKHLTEPVPSLAGVMPDADIPDGVELLVRSLMAKEPEARPANAVLLVNEIERLLSGDTGLAPHQATEAAVPAAAIAAAAATPPVTSSSPTRGGSAASFPRPTSSGVETVGAALAPSRSVSSTTPETAQGLPLQVAPVTAEQPPVAAKRGCFTTALIGCFGLFAIAMIGMFGVRALGILVGQQAEPDDMYDEAEVGRELEEPPSPPSPPSASDKDDDAPRKSSRRGRSKKRDRSTKTSKVDKTPPEPPAPPPVAPGRSFTDKLSIEHPTKLKNKHALDAFTSAVKRRNSRVFQAVSKLVDREGPLRAAQILNDYYEHNAERVAPSSSAAADLDAANTLVFEQYGRVVEKKMPGMLEALGEGDVDWVWPSEGSSVSAP
jgi:serine/threonine protein kinase